MFLENQRSPDSTSTSTPTIHIMYRNESFVDNNIKQKPLLKTTMNIKKK